MHFEALQARTERARTELVSIPVIQACLAGRVTRAQYLAFLGEAYHHVRHTVPLLMACGSRLEEPTASWLRPALAEYIAEESGHEQWILDDLRACGDDAEAARRAPPALATELMVAYVYDYIARIHPAGFLGMVHVLEGTSSALATRAAHAIARMGPRRVVMKLGEYGVQLLGDGKVYRLPAYPVREVHDPTGAGDTFAGGFVGSLCESGDHSFEASLCDVGFTRHFSSFLSLCFVSLRELQCP